MAKRFLADRYVEGTCPFCGYADARGDQCDNCGRLYDALELKNPRSKITGTTDLEVRETEHFFLDMGKMNEPLLEWIKARQGALAAQRDQLYARPAGTARTARPAPSHATSTGASPFRSAAMPDKRIYVWYDAVIGYLQRGDRVGQAQRRRRRPGATGGTPMSTPRR